MEDLAFYNQRYKAVRLLITILANVVIFRLLTRDALGLGSTHTHTHARKQARMHAQYIHIWLHVYIHKTLLIYIYDYRFT